MTVKKRQKKLFIGLSCLLAATIACGATAAAMSGHAEQEDSKTSWSEVMADNTLPQIESKNITFAPDTIIKIPDVDSLSTFRLDPNVNSREDIKRELPEICEVIFDDIFSYDKIELTDSVTGKSFRGSVSKKIDSVHYSARLSSNDSFVVYKSSTTKHSSMTGTPVEISRLDDGEPLSDKAFEMGTEQYTMQQALELCVNTMQKLSPHLEGLEYKPSRVIVFERDDKQGYAFRVEFSAYKDNVMLHDSHISGQIVESENIGFTGHCVYMLITEPDVVGTVHKCTGANLVDEKKIKSGYITLSEAVKLLNDRYTSDYKYTIDEVSVEYVITNELEKITIDNEGLEGLECSTVAASTVEPYWCFKVADTPKSNYENAYCREEQKIFVNMLTGKVYTYYNS